VILKLKEGKTYKARSGAEYTITARDSELYPWMLLSDGEETPYTPIWTARGSYYTDDITDPRDLLEEVPEKTEDTMQLQEGKTYKTRGGDVVTVTMRDDRDTEFAYPWRDVAGDSDNVNNWFRNNGRTGVDSVDSIHDLIEEVTYIEEITDKAYPTQPHAVLAEGISITEPRTPPMYLWKYGNMTILSPDSELPPDFEYIGEVQ